MKTSIGFILFFISTLGFSQSKFKQAEFIDRKAVSADAFVGFDKFDYSYFIKDNVLLKSKNSASMEYKNVTLGKITKVDLLNPLKVVVFYERFNTAVTLDNQLNETLKINFSELKVPLVVTKIGMAAQNQLWIFDEITSQLYLYDTGNGQLKTVGTPLSETINYYTSDFNSFEWLDAKNNWYRCSIYGAVQQLDYPFTFDKILFSNTEIIIYSEKETIFIFDRKSAVINALENVEKTFTSLTFKNQILSIFTNQIISNYKITLP